MSGGWSGGVFSLAVDMSANEAAGINIVSSAFSNQSDEIKDGINACLTKDGTNFPSADLPMATKKHTNVGAAVGITNYVRAHEYITQNPIYMRDSRSGSVTISCSATYWPTSAVEGMVARIKVGATKPQTSAVGLRCYINGLTLSAVGMDGNALPPGALVSGGIYEFICDGTEKFRCMNPSVSIKKYAVVWKARGTADASVTVISGATMTVMAAINGDVAYIYKDDVTEGDFVLGTSTGIDLLWSAAPSHLLADVVTRVPGVPLFTSADTTGTDHNGFLFVGTTGEIRIRADSAASSRFGSQLLVYPFAVTYPRKRTV
jgi:hypothetical protein